MDVCDHPLTELSRRALVLGAGAGALSLLTRRAKSHTLAGPVDPPEVPPAAKLTLEDSSATKLQDVLKGRVTAVQLMFTSCQATCPIQGALFGETLKKLGERSKLAQLLSISIDPERDTPEALGAWLKRFGASARWRAARPEKSQLEALVSFLKSRQPGPDPHTAQVYYFDRKGRLVMRSVDFPPASAIVTMLEQLATNGPK